MPNYTIVEREPPKWRVLIEDLNPHTFAGTWCWCNNRTGELRRMTTGLEPEDCPLHISSKDLTIPLPNDKLPL